MGRGLLQVGDELLGKLQVLREIGAGGFAAVYAVRHNKMMREMALKVMHAELTDESERKRFLREAEIMARFDSSHLPRIYDVGELESGSPYILMELLAGETLNDLLRQGPLEVERAVDLGVQACRGLAVAHRAGVLHRDLKPGNIFVSPREGGGEVLKLLDFGVATFTPGKTDRFGSLTKTNAIVGTPNYMSPEQVRAGKIDARADVYTMGVVLYQMLSGKRAFDGDNLRMILSQVFTGTYTPLEKAAPHAPPALCAVICKAMCHDPERRYASADALGDALERSLTADVGRNTVETLPGGGGVQRISEDHAAISKKAREFEATMQAGAVTPTPAAAAAAAPKPGLVTPAPSGRAPISSIARLLTPLSLTVPGLNKPRWGLIFGLAIGALSLGAAIAVAFWPEPQTELVAPATPTTAAAPSKIAAPAPTEAPDPEPPELTPTAEALPQGELPPEVELPVEAMPTPAPGMARRGRRPRPPTPPTAATESSMQASMQQESIEGQMGGMWNYDGELLNPF